MRFLFWCNKIDVASHVNEKETTKNSINSNWCARFLWVYNIQMPQTNKIDQRKKNQKLYYMIAIWHTQNTIIILILTMCIVSLVAIIAITPNTIIIVEITFSGTFETMELVWEKCFSYSYRNINFLSFSCFLMCE